LHPRRAFSCSTCSRKNNLPAYQGSRTTGTINFASCRVKTGTSYSFRDAWTAGVFDHYVLVVWVGNFDGKPNSALVGRSAAAPLFFSIVIRYARTTAGSERRFVGVERWIKFAAGRTSAR